MVERNIEADNSAMSLDIDFAPLDWEAPLPPNISSRTFSLILVAECIYNTESIPLLVNKLKRLIQRSPRAVILISIKVRITRANPCSGTSSTQSGFQRKFTNLTAGPWRTWVTVAAILPPAVDVYHPYCQVKGTNRFTTPLSSPYISDLVSALIVVRDAEDQR